jgi:hypothetical protein
VPDLWDTNPDKVFRPPDQPDPATSDHEDHTQEIRLRMIAADSGCPPTS